MNEKEKEAKSEPRSQGTENKKFYDELESEVISLRKENHKLRLTIEQYKMQTFQELSDEGKSGISSNEGYKSLLKNTYFEENKDKSDQVWTKDGLKQILDSKGKSNFDNVLHMVETSFLLIINNLLPTQFWRHIDSVDKPLNMSLSELNEFQKMSKLQKIDWVNYYL